MQAYEIRHLLAQQKEQEQSYLEFLRVPSLSMGVYSLAAGSIDPQEPHTEDEIYYVINGKAMIQVGTENREVATGSVIFVAAEVEHHFHTIVEDLVVLVFFAPAEYTRK